MKRKITFLSVAAAIGLVLVLGIPGWTAQLKSPDTDKTALRLLVQVSNDFKRQIMRDPAILFVHLLVIICLVARPGGIGSVIAESVLVFGSRITFASTVTS